ncbi:MAG: PAS domain-containing protein [Verrucomicrobiae bacterium]|nr:PAS domain-containing protein [Verrucomicrobiae bacterium]
MLLIVLVPCLVFLLFAGTTLVAFQMRMLRRDFVRDLQTVARIVADNAAAAVVFDDGRAAAELLRSLRTKANVLGAVLVLPDGTVLADYGNPVGQPVAHGDGGVLLRGREGFLVEPVVMDGQTVAWLNLVGDHTQVYSGLSRLVAWLLVGLTAAGAALVGVCLVWMRRVVTDPLARLTGVAQEIADRKDFSIRAREEEGRELGVLTRTFNEVLSRVQSQERAILDSHAKLESILESVHGVVWEADAVTRHTTFVSRQVEPLFRYPFRRWIEDPAFRLEIVHTGDRRRVEETYDKAVADSKGFQIDYRMLGADGRMIWIRENVAVESEDGRASCLRGVALDITEQKRAEEQLERLHRRLMESSRLAGMAEVATGILHNVGNVLNSVSVSVNLVAERLKRQQVGNLQRAVGMLRDRREDLARYLEDDPKGRLLPEYLGTAAGFLVMEHAELLNEIATLNRFVEHLKEIVAMQQAYAKVSGAYEPIDPAELVDDALRINAASFERHQIVVCRDVDPDLPRVIVDRHKALQILINLLGNAKHALDAGRTDGRRLTILIEPYNPEHIAIRVRDNGVGIASENLTRIFQHGFTTKKEGHGFGLHSGANAAREMGGHLTATSDGIGHGAEFVLVLKVAQAGDPRVLSDSHPGHGDSHAPEPLAGGASDDLSHDEPLP